MNDHIENAESHSFVRRHVYANRYILILTLIFIVLGVVYAKAYFPKLGTVQAVFGGIVIGLFGTLFAACHTQVWKE